MRPGPRVEHRYYRRVTIRAATRCWGLAIVLGTALPVAAQSTPPASPKPPAAPAYESAWSVPLAAPGPVHLAPDGTIVFALDAHQALAAFSITDGRVLWSVADVSPDARLAGGSDRLYVITPLQPERDGQPQVPGRLEALEPKDGHRVWSVEVNANPAVDPVLFTGSIVLATDRQLREFSVADGSLSWQQSFDAAVTAVAANGERIFVGLANRSVRSFDRKTHAPVMELRLEATATTLVLAERRLFIGGDDGSLSAYRNDRPDSLLWRVQRVEAVGRPVVDDRHVYVAEFDATARAYDVGNGTEHWRLRLASRPRAGVQIAAGWVYFPLLSGAIAVAPARTRSGQPSSVIPFGSAEEANDFRQQWSSITTDGRMLVRVTRPDSHPAWTLTAATRKDGS